MIYSSTPQAARSANSHRSKPIALLALTAAALSLPMTASAGDTQKITAKAYGQHISVAVPMALLSTDDGTVKIYRALERKAEKSCKTTIRLAVSPSLSVRRCTAMLLDGFVADLDDEGMTALHAESA